MKIECSHCLTGFQYTTKPKKPTICLVQCLDCKQYSTYLIGTKKPINLDKRKQNETNR